MPSTIPAAGTLPWRVRDGQLEVALIHRPRYRDWSWPKGKLDPGEDWPVAAARETQEETGLRVRLGTPLPEADYMVMAKDGTPAPKEVRYWAASVVSVGRRLPKEVDQMEWLEVAEAHSRLDYARDREQLLALVQAHQGGWLDTWPLVIVRHAKAVSRSDFKGSNDQLRPLDARGRERAQDLVPLLGVRGITRVISSPSRRCVDTITPYAVASDTPVLTKAGLSEEGFEVDPSRAPKHLEAVLRRAEPTLVCSHGPVLPALLDPLIARVDEGAPAGQATCSALSEAHAEHLVKGEALVCHLVGAGAAARVVAVERHLP